MATSTTLKLPEALEARIADAARTVGKSPHAFIVEAIERQTAFYERRAAFFGDALAARGAVAADGLVYDGGEVLSYLGERLNGGNPARPRARTL